tara:strand:- start:15334 stop:16179 length:846 start_codon:yes stop_codon:yes gene_type:complete
MAAITTRTLIEKAYDIATIAVPTDPSADLKEEIFGYWRAGARDVVSRAKQARPDLILGMVSQSSVAANTDYVSVDVDSVDTILSVRRNNYPCMQVSFNESQLYDDASSGSILESSIYHPVFFVDTSTADSSRVRVMPTNHTSIEVDLVEFSAIDAVDIYVATSANNLPTLSETLFLTYLAIRLIDNEIGNHITAGDYNGAIDSAKNFINSLTHNSIDIDVQARLEDDDIETASVAIQAAKNELDRAMGSLKEVEQLQARKNQLMQEYYGALGSSGGSQDKE